jgi:hypothetical protein
MAVARAASGYTHQLINARTGASITVSATQMICRVNS